MLWNNLIHRRVVYNVTLGRHGVGQSRRVGVGAMPCPVKEIPFLHLLGLGETRERKGGIGAAHKHVAYLRGELSPIHFCQGQGICESG